MSAILLRNGRIIDPANNRDETGDLAIVDGRIAPKIPEGSSFEEIDCRGLVVAPGLIDLHVHLREPGQSAKETIATGARAAAAGGFTSVVCMPNTSPTIDNPSVVGWIREKAEREACVNVFTTGAITKGIAGEELAPIGSMARAGIVALTDDGHCVQNHELMRRALEYARMFQLPVLDHCQDYGLVGKGVMHEGYWSTVLGLPGWPSAGEEIIVMRNVLLAELSGTPIHCQHLSSGESVRIMREARTRGVPISGEVCPHHIALTDEALQGYDTNYKMNPPLRAQKDVDALIQGIADGVVTILASDHAPHCAYEKEVEFDMAPFGIVGLETELGLFLDILVHKQKAIDLPRLIAMLTVEPARLLKLDRGTLTPGAAGDVTVIDPDREWTVDAGAFQSRSAKYALPWPRNQRPRGEDDCRGEDGLGLLTQKSEMNAECQRDIRSGTGPRYERVKKALFLLMTFGGFHLWACSALEPDALALFQQPGVPEPLYQKVRHGGALTLQDVITLSQAQVSHGAIIEYLYTFGRHFRLSLEDVAELRQQHVSNDLVDYMTSPGAHPSPFGF